MSLRATHHLEEIHAELGHHDRFHFLLDFDGTLAPIESQPDLVRLPGNVRDLVQRLRSVAEVSILSGRSLRDLQPRVGLDVNYAGNHGLEIEGPALHFRHPDASVRTAELKAVLEKLRLRLGGIRGVLIEDKDLTASVHYRNAQEGDADVVRKIVESAVRRTPFHTRKGKKVVEIRPAVNWDKGSAAEYLLRHSGPAFPIAMGDDVTDEDLFRSVPHGLTFKVGAGPTTAKYTVEDPSEAACVLESFLPAVRASGQGQTRR